MKVLHVIAGELNRGAAKGAYNLHLGLEKSGVVDSSIITNSANHICNAAVTSVGASPKGRLLSVIRRKLDRLPLLLYPRRNTNAFDCGLVGYDITQTAGYRRADIVHLHWICDGFLNLHLLKKVKKPLVWTFRDMWPLTGGCHYAMECKKYLNQCGNCPLLDSSQRLDLSYLVLWRKKHYVPKHTVIVPISGWLANCVTRSPLYSSNHLRTIPNSVDCGQFIPVEREAAREILDVPKSAVVVLTGAQNLTDRYKGFDLFLEAFRYVQGKPYLLLFGNLQEHALEGINAPYRNLGYLHDTVALKLAYSAADVFVAASRMEAFGKTVVEAMACGTPTVCFSSGAFEEIVMHKITGYLASPFDVEDLAKGISWCTQRSRSKSLSRAARDHAASHYGLETVANQYIGLYREIHQKCSKNYALGDCSQSGDYGPLTKG